ncbi:MAG: dockerin type I repeat-containing protein [Candidatus Zixiibacteriota bacterium]
MKRFFPYLLAVMLVLVFFNFSWSQCPEDPNDLGECDTLNVLCWDCAIDTSAPGPYFVRVLLLVTHDSNTFYWEYPDIWVQDSIAAFIIPLQWTHTNPSAYCSVSSYWNNSEFYGPPAERSVFRHLIDEATGDTLMVNRMMWMAWQYMNLEWDTKIVQASTDSSYFRMALATTSPEDRRWWEGERTLLATITFKVSDTMHVYIDSTFWPPNSKLSFTRYDAQVYFPRHNLAFSMWIGPPWIEVISPNGGEGWCVGDTEDITWLSENFSEDVKIEYSTNGGGGWNLITPSTENDGIYSWTVENTPSESCLVRLSDPSDENIYDESDGYFTIVEKSLAVTFPDGGETLIADSTYQITWSWSCVDSVTIEYSTDGGLSFTTVDTTESDGSYSWQVPDTPSDSCRVRVCGIDGVPCDTSDGDFTIVRPDFVIEVLPDTQSVYGGQDVNYYVTLYSIFGFSSPCTLSVSDLPPGATGVFDKPVLVYPYTDTSVLTITPADTTPEDQYLITITATEMAKGRNMIEHSTQVVLIVLTPSILVISPNGGEHLCVGKTEEITWSSEGLSGSSFVKIEHSTDAGTSWEPVADSTQNDGTFAWTVADTPSDSCLIRVSDASDGYPHDESDDYFTIFLAGDVNVDGRVDVADVVYLINYLFISGPAPFLFEAADVNLDQIIDSADVVYLLNYLFIGGPPPNC